MERAAKSAGVFVRTELELNYDVRVAVFIRKREDHVGRNYTFF
jgi:hypothetical protein